MTRSYEFINYKSITNEKGCFWFDPIKQEDLPINEAARIEILWTESKRKKKQQKLRVHKLKRILTIKIINNMEQVMFNEVVLYDDEFCTLLNTDSDDEFIESVIDLVEADEYYEQDNEVFTGKNNLIKIKFEGRFHIEFDKKELSVNDYYFRVFYDINEKIYKKLLKYCTDNYEIKTMDY